jgi:hypothetical protein
MGDQVVYADRPWEDQDAVPRHAAAGYLNGGPRRKIVLHHELEILYP